LKLTRTGNAFTAFQSDDAQTWTPLGTANVPMNRSVRVGLAVNANNSSALNSATFRYVSIGVNPVDPFLKQVGNHLRNGRGNGEIVPLRGVNVGAWLAHEAWFSGMDGSGETNPISLYETLTTSFGVAGRNQAFHTYAFNWITSTDLDAMRDWGMNCLRIPFAWFHFVEPDGSWRADAFTHLDWIVDEAWKRGMYSILDFHQVPGGAAPWPSSGDTGNTYFSTPAQQQLSANIWSNIALHFTGHPGVAAYDLINEPGGAPSTAILQSNANQLFWAVRNSDPDHAITVEGWPPGDFTSLPAPWANGWSNIFFQLHVYAFDESGYNPTTENLRNAADWAAGQAQWLYSNYNIPCYVGEFGGNSDPAAYAYQRSTYSQNGISWANWFWKNAVGQQGGDMGNYLPQSGVWLPNVQTDGLATILAAYQSQSSANGNFVPNQVAMQGLGMPTSVDDAYETTQGQPLYIPPAIGVLANDTDPNTSQSGMSAQLVSDVAHGSLSFWPDGSFHYTPSTGFVGTDSFRYRASDGAIDAVNIATVNIAVPAAVPPAPWNSFDVGDPDLDGTSVYDPTDSTWTLSAAGTDIWGATDEFHFACQPLRGDGVLMARVASLGLTDPWAKAGLMIRETLDTDSRHATLVVTPTNGAIMEGRAMPGDATDGIVTAGIDVPVWLKVVRLGDSFQGFVSMDGAAWTLVQAAQLEMAEDAYWGLVLTSHNTGVLATAGFENVGLAPLPADPRLTAARIGNSIAISWPETAHGYKLVKTESLVPPIQWSNVSRQVTNQGGLLQVVLQVTDTNEFFRLICD